MVSLTGNSLTLGVKRYVYFTASQRRDIVMGSFQQHGQKSRDKMPFDFYSRHFIVFP
jgi:hypothetical protein